MHWRAKFSRQLKLPTSWQELQHGARYSSALQVYFSDWIGKILGYQILKIGGLSAEISFDLPLRHQIILLTEYPHHLIPCYFQAEHSLIQSELTALPFIEKSIDACLLANTLNFCSDPHQLLREIQRVICDDGYLFISLFDLCSPMIFKSNLNVRKKKLPFRQFPLWRVMDWLELLNFEIIEHKKLPTFSYLQCFSTLNVIVARKRTYPLRLNPEKSTLTQGEFLQPMNAFKEQFIGYSEQRCSELKSTSR